MNPNYAYIADLAQEVEIPANGILSRTLYNDERLKAIVFGFDAGQELTAHTAPMPAIIHVLKGDAGLTLGAEKIEAGAGAWVHMPPQLEHGIYAKTPLVILLLMLKNA